MVEFANTSVADDAIPSLVKALEQPDAEVRSRVLLTMCYLSRHAKTLVPVIVPLLDDQDQNVRWHAVNALGFFRREARLALPSLRRIIEGESSQISAFAAGIAFLIDPTTDAEPRLQDFLRNGDAVTRWRAVEALGNMLPHKTLAKETEAALLHAFRLSEDEPSKLLVAQLLKQIRQGAVDEARPPDDDVPSHGDETRAELTEAPRWK
jgi:HEAT repeat protein